MTPSPRRCPRARHGGLYAARSGPMLHLSRGGDGRPHVGHAQARLELQGRHPEARPASSSTEVGMRLPPKMTPAQIAEAQRMAREWKRLGAPGRSRSACALDERAAPSEGSLLGLRSPLALLMKLAVALAQPVQSRFDPHHGLDAKADLFPFVGAKPLNKLVGALEKRRSWKARSFKSCAILRPADFFPASRKSTLAAALWLAARRATIAIH